MCSVLPDCDSVLQTSWIRRGTMSERTRHRWKHMVYKPHCWAPPATGYWPMLKQATWCEGEDTNRYLAVVGVVSICLGPLLSSVLQTKTVAFSCCPSSPSRIRQGCHTQIFPPLSYHSDPCKGAEGCIHTDAAGTGVLVLCCCHQSQRWGGREVGGDEGLDKRDKDPWKQSFGHGGS